MSWLLKPFGGTSKKVLSTTTDTITPVNHTNHNYSESSDNHNKSIQLHSSQEQYYFHSTPTVSTTYVNHHSGDPEYVPQHINDNKTSTQSVTPSNSTDAEFSATLSTHTLTTPSRNIKLHKFHKLLNSSPIDLTALRDLSWNGIPYSVRCDVWKLLLGYWPSNTQRRVQTIERRYNEYITLKQQYFNGDHNQTNSSSSTTINTMTPLQPDNDILHQVKLDVPRTCSSSQLFQSAQLQQSLIHVLYIWSIRHPASGYVQGINDLVIPFYTVNFQQLYSTDDISTIDPQTLSHSQLQRIECDVYWLLCILIDTIQDHYTFAQPGIQRMIYKLQELVERIDSKLYSHLQSNGIQFIQFSFRWVNCLLTREFTMNQLLRVWDTYISEQLNGHGFRQFHVYVCAALLIHYTHQLQSMDFQQLIQFLQNLPTHTFTQQDCDSILAQAYVYQSLFNGAKQI